MRLNNRIAANFASRSVSRFAAAIAASAICAIPWQSVRAASTDEALGKLAFAEELAVAAHQTPTAIVGGSKDSTHSIVQRSAALLRAACEECNFEPRFPRLYAEACRQMGDRDGAIDGLVRYRRIPLPAVKNDQFAQVELIDLYTADLQTNEKKIAYLTGLVQNASLPEPVRSHLAVQLSRLLDVKLMPKEARAQIAVALQLNPLNPEALQAKYVETQADGTAADQVAALIGLLRSNPAQPEVMGALGNELASVGQLDAAVEWYQRSFTAAQQIASPLDPSRYLDYSAALQLTGQPRKADDAAASVLSANASNARAATLRLLIARQMVNAPISGSKAADPLTITRAQQAMVTAMGAQIGGMHAELHGASTSQPAATQPYDLLGTIDSDAPRLRAFRAAPKNETQANFLDNYAAALTNLAWYYVYFDPQPAKANRLLDLLKPLVNDNNADLTRLQGYAFMIQGKKDEARVKLSAVADKDPLAKMGLILLDPTASGAAADASKLLTQNPSGILGVTLMDGLHDKGGKFVADPASAAAGDAARTFPMELLNFTAVGQATQFYTLLAQPIHTANSFDEPILVNVSIQNTGNFDLSLGNDAALRSDLWFDVFSQGGSNPHFEGIAYDRLAGPLVLKAHHLDQPGTSQIVRVDQGDLADYLTKHPTIALSMNFSVFLNPISQSSGVAPGPGGYRQQFSQPTEREASPISTPQQVQDVIKPATSGTISEKIHGLQLLESYVEYLREIQNFKPAARPAGSPQQTGVGSAPPPPDSVAAAPPVAPPGLNGGMNGAANAAANARAIQSIIDIFTAAIQSDLRDPSKLVQYWAQYQAARLGDENNRVNTAMSLLQGEDWEQRVLGLLLSSTLPSNRTRELSNIAANDSVDYVKQLAEATTNIATPTTAPSTPAANAPAQ